MQLVLAAMVLSVPPAMASTNDDLRCIAAISHSLATAETQQRAVLTTGMAYFVGRVEGAAPGTDIAAAVDRIKRAPDAQAVLERVGLSCAQQVLANTTLFARLDPAVARIEQNH